MTDRPEDYPPLLACQEALELANMRRQSLLGQTVTNDEFYSHLIKILGAPALGGLDAMALIVVAKHLVTTMHTLPDEEAKTSALNLVAAYLANAVTALEYTTGYCGESFTGDLQLFH
ncbi:hypothetical protein [Phyllobacterium sp. SB3]|uniref:hypothetical protein n=1 Tax=Phyllobacterium sp. SB3 TaxID=3156073 RepID=UPI0032AF8054